MIHDPYAVEPRKPLTSKQRLKLFLERKGICCICGHKIQTLKPWIDEHITPLWLGGSNDWSNRGVAHEWCARVKTSGEAKTRAKVRRTAEKHFGARKPSHPMPGSKRSGWKKTFNNGWVRR